MAEDMTPYAGSDLPDAERDRLDRLFPGSWCSAKQGRETDVIYAFQKVKERYADLITADFGPKLIRDWEKPFDAPRPRVEWAIVWEEGPDDWAITTSQADVFDRSRVFAEAVTGYTLGLYGP